MQADRRLVGEIDQRVGVAGDHVRRRAVGRAHRRTPDPVREVVGDALLEDPVALDAIREPLQVQRPVAQVRQHHVGDPLVIRRQLGLRRPVREEPLVGLGDLDARHEPRLPSPRGGDVPLVPRPLEP